LRHCSGNTGNEKKNCGENRTEFLMHGVSAFYLKFKFEPEAL
jgi:hypothetical protein